VSDSDRLNFTFFHEVSHHLIREDALLYSFLHEYVQGNQELKRVVETYCNFGAAEFIIPMQDLRHFLTDHGFSIAHIERLEETYPASKIAIAIQMAHCATHQCYVVVCEYGLPSRREEAQAPSNLLFESSQDSPGLYVCYTAQSPSITKYSIARHTRISKEHIIAIAYHQRSHIKGRDTIPFRSQTRWEVDCEACFLKGKVFAVFNVSPPLIHSSQQLDLFDDLSD
jgi:Zn-dependent peptidase ImmA (M78 family)